MKRLVPLYLLGALAGYLWISPVFTSPGSQLLVEGGFSVERVVRVASVLLILPFVLRRILRTLTRERIPRVMCWGFVFAPSLSLLNNPEIGFLVSTYGPLIVGGLSLLVLCSLREDEFHSWAYGVGSVSLFFLLLGLSRYGIETASYYGSRATYGFIHPTQTAAVVLMGGFFAVGTLHGALSRIAGVRIFLTSSVLGVFILLLVFAFSRNYILLVVISALGAGYAAITRQAMLKRLLAISVLLMPFVMFIVIVSLDAENMVWSNLNEFSSQRFLAYTTLINNMNRETFLSIMFGPSQYSISNDTVMRGFAGSESVYFSFYVNAGIVGVVSFCIFLLVLSMRLARAQEPVAYGILLGLVIFFSIDAQGVTPSNLAIFLLLAYCLRCSMSEKSRAIDRVLSAKSWGFSVFASRRIRPPPGLPRGNASTP